MGSHNTEMQTRFVFDNFPSQKILYGGDGVVGAIVREGWSGVGGLHHTMLRYYKLACTLVSVSACIPVCMPCLPRISATTGGARIKYIHRNIQSAFFFRSSRLHSTPMILKILI
jgi:hypothetical protein